MPLPQGSTWVYGAGGYHYDKVQSDFYAALRKSGYGGTLDSRCTMTPALLALVLGQDAGDVEKGFRLNN